MMHKTVIKEHLSCRKVEEFLMAYLDRELSLWTRVRFRFHLMICSDCSNYLQEYKNTIILGKNLFETPDASATGKVPDQILEAIINCK
jgi:anti-sigma factor RsiW